MQLVLAGLAVGGFAWLAVAGVLGLVGAHPSTPAVLRVPVPLVLFVVGLVGGAVTTFLARRAVAEGARRTRFAVAAKMRDAVQDVAWAHVVGPVATVLADHRDVRETLQRRH